MNEYEAHESSYDHQHKKRLKEMKEMQRQVAPKKEEEKGPLMQIKLGGTPKSAGGGFKKGGFKNAFAPAENVEVVKKEDELMLEIVAKVEDERMDDDSDLTDQEDYYDPRQPTGCTPSCPSKKVMRVA